MKSFEEFKEFMHGQRGLAHEQGTHRSHLEDIEYWTKVAWEFGQKKVHKEMALNKVRTRRVILWLVIVILIAVLKLLMT